MAENLPIRTQREYDQALARLWEVLTPNPVRRKKPNAKSLPTWWRPTMLVITLFPTHLPPTSFRVGSMRWVYAKLT